MCLKKQLKQNFNLILLYLFDFDYQVLIIKRMSTIFQDYHNFVEIKG
jgi:hypothetical protein